MIELRRTCASPDGVEKSELQVLTGLIARRS